MLCIYFTVRYMISYQSVNILKSLLVVQSLTLEILSLRWSKWSEGYWLQLICCTLPNIYVPNFKLEDLCQRFSVCLDVQGSEGGSEGWRVGGLEVLSSK